MNNAVTRARAWVSFALLIFAPVSMAQTMELYVGAGRFVDIPGDTVGIDPGVMVTGPDGQIYLTDIGGRIMRFNPATGTVTALPPVAGGLNYNVGVAGGIAFDPAGNLHVQTDGALFRLNLVDGTSTNLGPHTASGPIVFAPNGTMYFLNLNNDHRLYARSPAGVVTTIAGQRDPSSLGDGGLAVNAYLSFPKYLALAPNGDIYIADSGNQRIRKITAATGIITTVVGGGTAAVDGVPATQTRLDLLTAIARDAAGNLYLSDEHNWRIRRVDAVTNIITTVAGTGIQGVLGDGGPAVNARIASVKNLAVDNSGNLYFSDVWGTSKKIRKINVATGIVTKVLAHDAWLFCGEGVPPSWACLAQPSGLDVDLAGNLIIVDSFNGRLRKVSAATGLITTLPVPESLVLAPTSVEHDSTGYIYLASPGNNKIGRFNPATGASNVLAGSGQSGFAGDGGPAIAARLAQPGDMAIDAAGNVYIADAGNNRIRRVDAATSIISTIAGGSTPGFSGDGGPATAALLRNPQSVEFDPQGNLVIGDSGNCRLRRINRLTGIINTILGDGICGSKVPVEGAPATSTSIYLTAPWTIDASGNIWFTFVDWVGEIGRIDATTGVFHRVPLPPGTLMTVEGLKLNGARAIEIDSYGNAYIADRNRPYVFKVTTIVDTTPPIIQANVTGVAGTNGWYRGDVQLTWTVSDTESGFTSTGCAVSSVTSDTAGVTFTCSATSGGGSASSSVTIKRDTVAPTLAFGNSSPAADEHGWRGAPVTVPFEAVDALSGVYSTSSPNPLSITESGNSVIGQVVVTDNAGNSGTFSTPAFNIDGTPPIVSMHVIGTRAGNSDWYRTDVQIVWGVLDPDSQVLTQDCDNVTLTTDTAGTTYTCSGTSTGGSVTQSVTIKRDATPPTLEWSAPSPAPNAAGWFTSNVEFTFTTDDATSGVSGTSQSTPGPVIVTEDGPGQTSQITVYDNAGNQAIFFTPPVNIDHLPPIVQPFVNGVMGPSVWHNDDVQLHWNIAENNILESNGCEDRLIDTDTAGTTFTCTVTSGAGTTTESVTIKRDATPPTLVFGPPSPAPNASGWHNGDVSFAFTTSDGTSGVASTSSSGPVVITGEGTGLTATVTVIDTAGNSASFATPPVNIDRSPQANVTVTPVIAGTLGNEGWYTSDVQVSWNITGNILGSTGCGVSNVTTDTAAVTFFCSVTSASGTVSNSVTLKRDATPPLLNWRAATPNANAAGWNRTNVNFPFDPPTDARSGIASVSTTSPLVVSAEGAGVTGSVTVTDRAGNVAVFTTTPRNIDKTAPTVNIRTPLHNKMYGLYSTLIADFDCTDAVSTTTSCSGTLADGATLNTRAMNGSYKFQVTSADMAGNSVTRSNTWSVAGTFLFEGYLAPMANDPTYNLVTAGSRVPMRFRLPDRNGGYVSDATAFQNFTVNSERCISSSVPLNDVATGSAGLSFDPGTSTFTYNWDTNASWAGTCRNVFIRLVDGSRHTLFFKFQ